MQRESDLFITSMITDRIGRHKVLLPINHKNYNFREKKNSQVMKERENLHKKLTKGDVNILRALAKENTLLRTHCCRHKCFLVCPSRQHLLRTQILCTQKMFLILFRNVLCPQQMFPSLRSPRNIMGNNVSSFTRAFSFWF